MICYSKSKLHRIKAELPTPIVQRSHYNIPAASHFLTDLTLSILSKVQNSGKSFTYHYAANWLRSRPKRKSALWKVNYKNIFFSSQYHYHRCANNTNDEIMDGMFMGWKILHNDGKWFGSSLWFPSRLAIMSMKMKKQIILLNFFSSDFVTCSNFSPRNLIYCWCQILLVFPTHRNKTLNRNFLLV